MVQGHGGHVQSGRACVHVARDVHVQMGRVCVGGVHGEEAHDGVVRGGEEGRGEGSRPAACGNVYQDGDLLLGGAHDDEAHGGVCLGDHVSCGEG